ncbi:MAG TPA: xanthine dehydrogenase family protein subunit M [Elusimicrobiota bacterium]|nr:xanthine dehydrogenase family protein subunit M [Elusimicrobiota bacterium]
MPIAHEFDYHKPKTLPEAVKLLAEYRGKAKPLAGGTDLIVWLKGGLEKPEAVVDIKALRELGRIVWKKDEALIGALITFSELIDNADVRKKLPVLWEASRTVASVGVRNRATLAGNICSAVPSLDSAPALLVYDAVVHLQGPRGKRQMPLKDFFMGPKKTALAPGELVTGVAVRIPKKKSGGCYAKLGRYAGEDLAQVGLAVLALADNTYRVAHCAVGPVARRAEKIEGLLNGKRLSDILLEEAVRLVDKEISPISDIRSSKEYRLHMTKVMLRRALWAAVNRLAGSGPVAGSSLI